MINICYTMPSFDGKYLEEARRLFVNRLEVSLPLADMSAGDREDVRDQLIDAGMRIDILRSEVDGTDYDAARNLFLTAHALRIPNVLLTVRMDATGEITLQKMAASQSIRLLRESGPSSEESAIPSGYGLVFDPSAYVRANIHPFLSAFTVSHRKNDIAALRLCDALYGGGAVTPGSGCGELKEMVSILLARCFDGEFLLTCQGLKNEQEEQLIWLKKSLKRL